MAWNYGDIFDAIARVVPGDAPALIHGERVITWAEMDARSNNLARAMLARGAAHGDKVAFYMRNRPNYTETLVAVFKARLVHVNVNYRYTPEEVLYILDNSDATVIVYDRDFGAAIAAIRDRLTKVRLFIEVTDDGLADPGAVDYEALARAGDGAPLGIDRSPDDLLFIYTGGTTGMPKGVMWRQDDLREGQLAGLRPLGPVPESLDELVAAISLSGPTGRIIPACPLMHGTGLLTALGVIASGGCVITLTSPGLDARELWTAAARHRADRIAIVGDAFARPMVQVLDDAPGAFDLSALATIISSGVMWSVEVKRRLIAHLPQVILADSFGSSEGIGFGSALMTKDGEVATARFMISERCRVFDAEDKPVTPGSGVRGIIALGGNIPVGYYKDPVKTASTFKTIDGKRYSMPGDWCLVEADGSLTLLGRGSVCINTAGEKVFPEEVEEALKTHPLVEDALVLGVPDEKWGQAVAAAVRVAPGFVFDEDALRAHVRARLAGYKTPKRILEATLPFRAPNGKADYKSVGEFVRARLGAGAPA